MKSSLKLLALSGLLATTLHAQFVDVFVPDSRANASIAANAIPFAPAFGPVIGAFTHLEIIPASFLANAQVAPGTRLTDIRFAPCGTGVLSAPQFVAFIGHLGSAVPTGTFQSAFVDQTPLYNSAVQGPFIWPCAANTWSSMRVGGGGFQWDGVHDIGLYTSHQGLTITTTSGWIGTFRREGVTFRSYANAWTAPAPTTISQTGLKVNLVFAAQGTYVAAAAPYGVGTGGTLGVPVITSVGLAEYGNGAFGIELSNAQPFQAAILLLSLSAADVQLGVGGSNVHLLVDVAPGIFLGAFNYATDATGRVFLPTPVPANSAVLPGFSVFCQWAVLGDPAAPANILGVPVVTTAAVQVVVGA